MEKARNVFFVIGGLMLALYSACIFAGMDSLESGAAGAILSIGTGAILCIIPVFYLLNRKVIKLPAQRDYSSRELRGIFIGTSLFAFLVLIFWWLGYMPGGFEGDPLSQWNQAVMGSYDNQHPFIHTLLFFVLPRKIYDHPSTGLIVQFLAYSLSVGYLAYTMARHRCNKIYLLFSIAYMAINPAILTTLMYLWKDCAFACAMIVLIAMTLNIYFSRGKWLEPLKNKAALSVVLTLATLFRHNAFLFTGTYCLILLIFWNWKHMVKIMLMSLLQICLIMGPLYGAFQVRSTIGGTLQVLGLPISVLGNVLVKEPEALDEETKDFLYQILPKEVWEEYYEVGEFGVVRYGDLGLEPANEAVIDEYGTMFVLRSTLRAFVSSPKYALEAVWTITDMVWDIGNEVDYSTYPANPGIQFSYTGIEPLKILTDKITWISMKGIQGILFWNIGLWMYLIFFLGVRQIKYGDVKKALLVLPFLAYNFGTMFMLAGKDLRFFMFNFSVGFAMVFLLETETCEKNVCIEEN